MTTVYSSTSDITALFTECFGLPLSLPQAHPDEATCGKDREGSMGSAGMGKTISREETGVTCGSVAIHTCDIIKWVYRIVYHTDYHNSRGV